MKARFKNNLSNQTNDVMFNPGNPVNPDSNNWLLRAKFPPKHACLVFYFSYYRRAGILSRG
jgi:hypothetical protein